MSQQVVNHGTTVADGTGETLFASFEKLNANDAELYAADAAEITARNNAISAAIATEVTNRNAADAAAIATEVTNRNAAIAAADATVLATTRLGTEISSRANQPAPALTAVLPLTNAAGSVAEKVTVEALMAGAPPNLRAGFRLMTWGNSLDENSYEPAYSSGTTTIKRRNPRGFMHYIRQQMQYPWYEVYAAGKGGTTTVLALARIDDVLTAPLKPHAVWTILGGNDPIADIDIATVSIPNLQSMMTTFANANILPLCSIDWGPTDLDSAHRAELDKFFWTMWLWCLANGYPFLDIRTPMVRSETQLKGAATYSRSGVTVTWTKTAHGYVDGDFIYPTEATDATLESVVEVQTVADANTFTAAHPQATGTTTGSANVVRAHSLNGKTIDGLHTSMFGASDIGDYLAGTFAQWPMTASRPLAVENFDYENLVGAGSDTASTSISCGMAAGAGGTKTGTPAPTGTVADGWVVGSLSPSTGGTITCSKGLRAAPLEHIPTQIVALASDGQTSPSVHVYCGSPKPAAWTAQGVTLGSWRTVTNGGNLWLCCLTAGTSATQPVLTEATTPPGTVITTDGNVVWIVRRGWQVGDEVFLSGLATITAAANAAGAIPAGTLTDVCRLLSFGMKTGASGQGVDDITDMVNGTTSSTGAATEADTATLLSVRRRVGQPYYFSCRGVISGTPSTLFVGFNIATKKGNLNSVTVEMSQLTMLNLTALNVAI